MTTYKYLAVSEKGDVINDDKGYSNGSIDDRQCQPTRFYKDTQWIKFVRNTQKPIITYRSEFGINKYNRDEKTK